MSGSVGKLPSVFLLVTVLWHSEPIPTRDSPTSGRATPAVISTYPVSQSVRAGPHHTIEVRFDRAIDPKSVSERSVYVFGRWSGVVSGTFSFEEAVTVLHFVPDRPFFAGEWVTVSLSRAIRSADGASAAHAYSWNYWIVAEPGSLDLETGDQREIRRPGEGWVQAYGAYGGDLNGDGFSDLMIPNERTADVRVT